MLQKRKKLKRCLAISRYYSGEGGAANSVKVGPEGNKRRKGGRMERRLLTKCGTENGNGELNRRLGGGNERKPASMEHEKLALNNIQENRPLAPAPRMDARYKRRGTEEARAAVLSLVSSASARNATQHNATQAHESRMRRR